MNHVGDSDTTRFSVLRSFVFVFLVFELLSLAMHEIVLRSLPGPTGAAVGTTAFLWWYEGHRARRGQRLE